MFEATPAEALLPLVSSGRFGARTAADAASLRDDLANPVGFEPVGSQPTMALADVEQIVTAMTELTRADPAGRDVVVNLFGQRTTAALGNLQGAFLDTVFFGVFALVAAGRPVEPVIDDLIRTAASVAPSGRLLREMLILRDRQPAPVDPTLAGPPGLPGIPAVLLLTAEGLRRKGCANAVKIAMIRWGSEVAGSLPSYLVDVIDALTPADACTGEEIAITGAGFGDGTNATVAFSGTDGKAVLCTPAEILEWTATRIRVRVPGAARRGPVGILTFPAAGGGGTLAELAATAIGEMGACFGQAAVLPLLDAARKVLPPHFAPNPDSTGTNLYTGGPPVIEMFAVSPTGALWPGRSIELRWNVIGADDVQIVARDAQGSAANELPAIAGPLTYPTGSATVAVPGTRRWQGQYVLRARNRCTPVDAPAERSLSFDMSLRRGLALGGGGTRGDFQVGALLYLYEGTGYRPEAIAGTSVGSINAIDLILGDDPATPATATAPAVPARSAAARLASTWTALTGEHEMFTEEAWLAQAKKTVRSVMRLIGWNLLFFPLESVLAGGVTAFDSKALYDNPRAAGTTGLFNLDPIEARARGQHDQQRVDNTGIVARLVSVSVETSELVMVDAQGGIHLRGAQPVATTPAPTTDVIDGAIASATMPGIFPARRLGDHMCVDGGVRDVVPVGVAVQDLGCNEVIAIRCSANPAVQATDPRRAFFEVMGRSVLDIAFDELADDDVDPFGGYGDGVRVRTIFPTFNLHDPMVLQPGLIAIAMDYGWMRAADVINPPAGQQGYAMELSDRITLLRAKNYQLAHRAYAIAYADPHRDFASLIASGIQIPDQTGAQSVFEPLAVDDIRTNCRLIHDALGQRRLIGAPTKAPAVINRWFTEWESIPAATFGTPWDPFSSTAGNLPSATPPTVF